MSRRIDSLYGCFEHLKNLESECLSRDVEKKVVAIMPYLWVAGTPSPFNIWPYRRQEGLGFCLLQDGEHLPEDGRAQRNFLIMKPQENSVDYYRRGQVGLHPGFASMSFNSFVGLDDTYFLKLFLGAAQSRAENINNYIY
ncbi:MAG: hypothetical protein NVS3B3_24690 [Aquirhabdus sp.]